MTKKLKVLATACCGMPTGNNILTMKRNDLGIDVEVIGIDCYTTPAAKKYVDHLYESPMDDDDEYIPFIMDLCEKHGVDVVMPLISTCLTKLSAHASEFEGIGAHVMVTRDTNALMVANDKVMLHEALGSRDYMPKTAVVRTFEEALHAPFDLGYPDKPVIVKLPDIGGSRGFRVLDDRRTAEDVINASRGQNYISYDMFLKAFATKPRRVVLQEFVSGAESCVCMLADHGEPVYTVVHRNKTADYSTATDAEIVRDERIEEIANGLCKELGLEYNIGFDFKEDEDGNPKLLEINPRVTATCQLIATGGINLMLFGAMQAAGIEYPRDLKPLYGLRLVRDYGCTYCYGDEVYDA